MPRTHRGQPPLGYRPPDFTADERRATLAKLEQYQAIFETH